MKFRNIVYPAPESSYMPNNDGLEYGNLLFIQRNKAESSSIEEPLSYIPTLLIRYDGRFGGSTKVLLFFHGNAEDIGLAEDLLHHLSDSLELHWIGVEYPGYGIYRDATASDLGIEEDAIAVYDYLTKEFGIEEQNIIVFGRSIGSGPASYLAAKRNPGLLVLMSPFTSIIDVAGSLIGKWTKWFVSDVFRNVDLMKEVTWPTYILHGEIDNLIPYEHAEKLAAEWKGVTDLRIPPEMDHNNFDFYDDLIQPLISFMLKNNILVHPPEDFPYKYAELEFPEELFETPKWYREEKNQKKMQAKSRVRDIASKWQN